MHVDPRFTVETRWTGEALALVARSRGALLVREAVTSFAKIGFPELAELARVPASGIEALSRRRERGIFANGWQSWSYAGELFGREAVRPAWLYTNVNHFVYRPGERERRGSVLSHLFTHLRAGAGRLILVSHGPSPVTAGAPLAFRIDRGSLEVEFELLAGGTTYEAGGVIAEIRIAWREGFFAERDFLKSVFAEHRDFSRLDFLGSGEGLVPGGYESWYNHYTDIDGKNLRAGLEALVSNDNLINSHYLKKGKPTVFQIDDGWEKAVGDWEPDPVKFPEGMAPLAADIEKAGLIPGLWVAPFIVTKGSRAFAERSTWLLRDEKGRPVTVGWNNVWDGDFHALDLSIPEVGDWLDELFGTIIDDWGYRYLKLDFLYAGFVYGLRRERGAAWEHYDRTVTRITKRLRDAKGRQVAWLGCGAPLEPSYRAFPLMRIGADTRETWDYPQAKFIRHQGRPAAKVNLSHTIARSLLDGALFVNDPDVVFCREKGMGYGEKEKELIALVARLFASQIMFSDDAPDFGSPGEVAFTTRVVGLYERLAGAEFGAERIARDVWSVFSRDGAMLGWINLRDRPFALRDGRCAALAESSTLVLHASLEEGGLRLEPRSISLFDTRGGASRPSTEVAGGR